MLLKSTGIIIYVSKSSFMLSKSSYIPVDNDTGFGKNLMLVIDRTNKLDGQNYRLTDNLLNACLQFSEI